MAESLQNAVSDITTKVAETLGVTPQVGEEKPVGGGVVTGSQDGESFRHTRGSFGDSRGK